MTESGVLSRPRAHAAPRRAFVVRSRHVLSGILFVLLVVLLWPAHFGGITGLTVVDGISMEPTYHTGDLVISVRQFDYAPGDVVSYLVPAGQPGEGGRVIHRIFTVDSTSSTEILTTKGDNNRQIDPWQVAPGDVLGRAVFAIPAVGILFGQLGNPIVIGLAAGLFVTILLWQSPRRGRRRAEKAR